MEAALILNDPQFERAVERIVRRLTAFDPWLPPKQMAEHAGVSKDHVLRALRAGAIEHVGEGKLIRARQSAVDHWLANTKKKEHANV
jgi:excisionase family DNA binding protein